MLLPILSLLACTPLLDGDAVEEDRLDASDLLVVAPADLAGAWGPFVEWKRARGVATRLESVEDLLAAEEGADDAARLKARLARGWAEEGVTHVLLAGDTPDLPHREVSTFFALDVTGGNETTAFASDLYFADLDSDWDADGDGVWAEAEDAPDLLPEIALGRVTAATEEEIAAWTAKLFEYERAPDPTWLATAMLMGELAGQYGGIDFYSSSAQETMILPLFPSDFDVVRLYADAESFDGALPNDADTQRDEVEGGRNWTLNFGHGSEWYLGRLTLEEVWDLPDTGHPGIFTTVECDACAFDVALPAHTTCEAWILGEGGGVAYLGNTAIGIGFPTLTEYYIAFYTALFEDDLDTSLGRRVADAQIATFSPEALLEEGELDRWAALAMVFMGDPSMIPWRSEPRAPEVTGPDRFHTADGDDAACVEVRLDGPVEGATASFYGPGSFLRVAITDADGRACALLPDDAGDWTVTVTGPSLLPTERPGD